MTSEMGTLSAILDYIKRIHRWPVMSFTNGQQYSALMLLMLLTRQICWTDVKINQMPYCFSCVFMLKTCSNKLVGFKFVHFALQIATSFGFPVLPWFYVRISEKVQSIKGHCNFSPFINIFEAFSNIPNGFQIFSWVERRLQFSPLLLSLSVDRRL